MNTKIILGDRQTGKTTELIKQSVALGAPIVCQFKDEPELIRKLAVENGIQVPETIMASDLMEYQTSSSGRDFPNGICIDDPWMLLKTLLNYVDIAAVTVNLSDVVNIQLLTIENASRRKSSRK